MKEMKRRGITIHDMIGLPNHGVDPNPEDRTTPPCEKGIRSNRFQGFMGYDRMKELLCAGKYSEWDDYPPLKIPLQDLFRFWWNRCVEKALVVDEVMEDIFDYFTEMMTPPKEEPAQMDMTLDFDQVPLPHEVLATRPHATGNPIKRRPGHEISQEVIAE